MNFLNYFKASKCETANQAKERLQALGNKQPTNIISALKEDIMNAISGYQEVILQQVTVKHDKKRSVINLAIPLK